MKLSPNVSVNSKLHFEFNILNFQRVKFSSPRPVGNCAQMSHLRAIPGDQMTRPPPGKHMRKIIIIKVLKKTHSTYKMSRCFLQLKKKSYYETGTFS